MALDSIVTMPSVIIAAGSRAMKPAPEKASAPGWWKRAR